MMKSTIHDVAKNAGVSVATVSHVINGTHYVSPELADRVYQSISKLNYRQNKLARALSRQEYPASGINRTGYQQPLLVSFGKSGPGCYGSL